MKVSGILSVVSLMAVFAVGSTVANAAAEESADKTGGVNELVCKKSKGCSKECLKTLKGDESLKPCNLTFEGKTVKMTCTPEEFDTLMKSIKQTDPKCGKCTIKCKEVAKKAKK